MLYSTHSAKLAQRRERGFTRTPTLHPTSTTTLAVREQTHRSNHFDKKSMLVCGFTLIETLVAVAILLIAIVGPISVASEGMKLGRHAKDQMVASYLAQDAIEYVRAVMITNSRNGNPLMNNLVGCDGPTNMCTIDTKANTVVQSCVGACLSPLKLDTNNLYQYTSGDNTPFVRSVKIDSVDSPGSLFANLPSNREYRITVTVSWGVGKSIQVVSDYVDWHVIF